MEHQAAEDSHPNEKFLHIPYQERWEYLRPTILRLFMEEKERMAAVIERMKNEYSFSAT